jgi:hypothetical protein
VQRVTSLSKNIPLCSYVLISFLQSEPHFSESIKQPSAWFPILDRTTVHYEYSRKGSVFVRLIAGNMERSPLCYGF